MTVSVACVGTDSSAAGSPLTVMRDALTMISAPVGVGSDTLMVACPSTSVMLLHDPPCHCASRYRPTPLPTGAAYCPDTDTTELFSEVTTRPCVLVTGISVPSSKPTAAYTNAVCDTSVSAWLTVATTVNVPCAAIWLGTLPSVMDCTGVTISSIGRTARLLTTTAVLPSNRPRVLEISAVPTATPVTTAEPETCATAVALLCSCDATMLVTSAVNWLVALMRNVAITLTVADWYTCAQPASAFSRPEIAPRTPSDTLHDSGMSGYQTRTRIVLLSEP